MVNGLCQNQEKNPDLDSYFTAGFETMCYAIPIFHEKYGLSLKITDINTAYTIGAIELRKEALFKQIRDEGLDQINTKLPLPHISTIGNYFIRICSRICRLYKAS
jgi:exonuclease VII large subunit